MQFKRRRINKRVADALLNNAHFYPFFGSLFVQLVNHGEILLFQICRNVIFYNDKQVYIAFLFEPLQPVIGVVCI